MLNMAREKRCPGRGNRGADAQRPMCAMTFKVSGKVNQGEHGRMGWPGRLERSRCQEMQSMLVSWGEFQFILGSVGRSGVAESQQHPN